MSSQGRFPPAGGVPLNVERRKFSLTIGRALGKVVVTVSGALDVDTAPELRHRLTDLIDGQGNRHLAIELHGMTSIDRVGIAVLVDALKRLQRNAGTLVLSGPADDIVSALAAAGVEKAFAVTRAWAHPTQGGSSGWESEALPAS